MAAFGRQIKRCVCGLAKRDLCVTAGTACSLCWQRHMLQCGTVIHRLNVRVIVGSLGGMIGELYVSEVA